MTNAAVERLLIRHECKVEIGVGNDALSIRIDPVTQNGDIRRWGSSEGVGGARGDGDRRTERDECKPQHDKILSAHVGEMFAFVGRAWMARVRGTGVKMPLLSY